MKTSTTIAMVFTMVAISSALPPPLRSNFSTSHADKKGGFTLQARQDTVPRCSVPCIQNAIAKVTDCHFADYACACKYHGKVSGAATACVVGSCGLQRAVRMYYLSFSSAAASIRIPYLLYLLHLLHLLHLLPLLILPSFLNFHHLS